MSNLILVCFLLLSSTVWSVPPFTGTSTVFVNYSNDATNSDLHESPYLYVSFDENDRRIPFIMDTGSVGVVASSDIFKHASGSTDLGKGHQFYSSSGIIEEGRWWTSTVKIYDKDGTLLAISNVPVLEVTKEECSKNARHCTPTNHPKDISVMGVGFARESKSQPRGTPEYNAFLNLTSVNIGGTMQPLPGDWVNGYVVTPSGVYLGLTDANTAEAGWVKLSPWTQFSTAQLPEWKPVPMTVDVNGTAGNGNTLLDTGVGTGYLTPPPGAIIGTLVQCEKSKLVECLPDGDTIGVYLPNQTNAVAYYHFTIGDTSNLMMPKRGVHNVKGTNTFFNTSRDILGGINFIYDNTNGYTGYIWNGMSGSDVGYVIPSVQTTTTNVFSSRNPSDYKQTVTFTATVVSSDPSSTPTGTISFVIDGIHHEETLANGQAQYSTATLSPGSHSVQARYSGDSQFIRSASPTLRQCVRCNNCW